MFVPKLTLKTMRLLNAVIGADLQTLNEQLDKTRDIEAIRQITSTRAWLFELSRKISTSNQFEMPMQLIKIDMNKIEEEHEGLHRADPSWLMMKANFDVLVGLLKEYNDE